MPAPAKKTNQIPKADPKPVMSPVKRRLRQWFLWSCGVTFLLGVGLAAYAFSYTSRVLPHTSVSGVALGGLTREQALQRLSVAEANFSKQPLTLTYQMQHWSVDPAQLQLSFGAADAVDQVYHYGKQGSPFEQLGQELEALVAKRSAQETVSLSSDSGKQYLQKTVLNNLEQLAVETSLDFKPGAVTVVPGKPGQHLDLDQLSQGVSRAMGQGVHQVGLVLSPSQPQILPAQAEAARAQANLILAKSWTIQVGTSSFSIGPSDLASWLSTVANGKTLQLSLKDDLMQKTIADWVAKTSRKSTNAQLQLENGIVVVVQDGQAGVTFDPAQTLASLKEALNAPNPSYMVVVPSKVVLPEVRSDTLASLGIHELIGTGTTDFSGSPQNRVTNIGVGQRALRGLLVQDGQEFSTISNLTPIDQSNGYVQALVIIGNQTLPADGGGLCQVSTTLFRAVLNAGLPVTARANHLYEVSYYQRGVGPGLDATIYDPQPDFKWKNDTGHAIYVQSFIKGNTLTFELYGTADGRTTTLDGPHTLQTYQPSGDPIRVTTDSLAPGASQLIDPPVPGARTTVTYTVNRGGKQLNQQTFNSYYQAMPAQYLVGPGPSPSPSPSASPSATP